jgi:hypothetical protein
MGASDCRAQPPEGGASLRAGVCESTDAASGPRKERVKSKWDMHVLLLMLSLGHSLWQEACIQMLLTRVA